MSAKPSSEPVEIVPNLYLGSMLSAHNHEVLVEHQIGAILNCAIEIPSALSNSDQIEYLQLAMDDDPDFELSSLVEEGLAYLDAQMKVGRRTLVHCQAGISRSVTVILAYLMTRQAMPLREAYFLVKERRPQSQPNMGFFKYLEALDKQLRGQSSFVYLDYLITVLVDMGIEEHRAVELVRRYGDYRLDILLSQAFNL